MSQTTTVTDLADQASTMNHGVRRVSVIGATRAGRRFSLGGYIDTSSSSTMARHRAMLTARDAQ